MRLALTNCLWRGATNMVLALGLKPRQKKLAGPSPDLLAERLPAVLKANIGAAAKRSGCLLRRQLKIELKYALQRFRAMRIAWINRERAAARSTERLARQVFAAARNLANDARRHHFV